MFAAVLAGVLAAAGPALGHHAQRGPAQPDPGTPAADAPAPPSFGPGCAWCPAADTTLRVPGTGLRFGMTLPMVERRIATVEAPAPPGAVLRQAKMRCFGLEADATLEFGSGFLTHASFTVKDPSPREIDYVEDELARQGFRRRCTQRDGLDRRCEWTGRVRVEFFSSAGTLSLEAEPPPGVTLPASAGAPAATPAPAEPGLTPAPPETLGMAASESPDSVPAPRMLDSCQAVRPPAAREAGVFGRVRLEVLVDTTGAVIDARINRSVPMLDLAALECARRFRFERPLLRGRPVRVWVPISIRFVL